MMPNRILNDMGTGGQVESNYDKTINSFDEMNLKSELLRGVYECGLESPSSVQQRAIMPMIKGDDVIVEAPFATGKTFSYCISALQTIDPNIKTCQALILTPTTVVTQAIQRTITNLGHFTQINCLTILKSYGVDEDIKTLHDGPQIVIGTPGRILNLIRRRAFTVDTIKLVVLDEADETIARGFTEHILAIHQLVPKSAQIVFLSTTIPDDVLETANKLMRDPLHIVVKPKFDFSRNRQFYIAIEREDLRLDILSDFSAALEVTQVVIFCNTRKKVEWLADELTTRGITTYVMHYDKPAYERADIVKEFLSGSGSSHIVIATNYLARGLDFKRSSLVINYELPTKTEDYPHRTNYNTHSERRCVTINLTTPAEAGKIHEIEDHYGSQIKELSFPEKDTISGFMEDIFEEDS